VVGEEGEKIDNLLAEIQEEGKAAAAGESKETEPPPEPAPPEEAGMGGSMGGGGGEVSVETAAESPFSRGTPASPLARTLADRYGLDIAKIRGSGPDGRVVKRDVEAARASGTVGPAAGGRARPSLPSTSPLSSQSPPSPGAPPTVPEGEPYRPGPVPAREEPISRKRAVIAKRLAESKFAAPHFYERIDIDVGPLMESRRRLNESRHKVSFNAFLIRFVAEALRRHPVVNSSWSGEKILRFGRADIGLAVAQPDGLVAPVVRDCWNRSIPDIDRDLKILIDRARNNRLKPEDYSGATFTISSLGSFGIHEFTAIVNPPGSAILAVGEARKLPVVTGDDDIDIVLTMTVTLSCDHRVIDGAEAANFLRDLRGMIEDPFQVLY
jgi:pyruvate dehydrogenase E2 component (dihydrolipoamide acetyltransferase)